MGDELRWDGEHAPPRPPKPNMSVSAQHSVVDEIVFGRDYDYSKLVRARARTHAQEIEMYMHHAHALHHAHAVHAHVHARYAWIAYARTPCPDRATAERIRESLSGQRWPCPAALPCSGAAVQPCSRAYPRPPQLRPSPRVRAHAADLSARSPPPPHLTAALTSHLGARAAGCAAAALAR